MSENPISRDEIINNYLLTIQILFNFLILIIVYKYLNLDYYSFDGKGSVIFSLFLFVLITSISYVAMHKKIFWLDFAIIFLDVFLINAIIVYTNLYETRFLYLMPIIIVAIKQRHTINIIFAFLIGTYNLIFDHFTKHVLGYDIQTDLILFGVFITFSWLIGSLVKVEKKVRNKLSQTNKTLIENKALMETIISQMPLGLITIDKDENIVLINQQAIDMGPLQKKDREVDYDPQNIECDKYEFLDNHITDKVLKSLHNGMEYSNEKIVWNNIYRLSCQPIYGFHGEIKYALAVLQDITSEELINEKMRNYEQTNITSQMAAIIAHEIKNPLTTIKGFLQLGLKSQDNLQKPQLELLISEIERCNQIINDFLSTKKKGTISSKEKYNLKNIVENHIPLIDKDALYNNIRLDLKLNEVGDIMLNVSEIKQLLLNLTRNAIEAMANQGVLTISLWEEKEEIILEIEDQGEGIPDSVLEKIGTPFVTTKASGTGLGLTVCKRICENHNAKISFENLQGKGTKVRIIFKKSEHI